MKRVEFGELEFPDEHAPPGKSFILKYVFLPHNFLSWCAFAEASPGNSVLDELEHGGGQWGLSPDELSEMPDRLGPLPGGSSRHAA